MRRATNTTQNIRLQHAEEATAHHPASTECRDEQQDKDRSGQNPK
jgi:hypothetical protein